METTTQKNNRPKLELQLDQRVMLTLMKDKPYNGQSAFGPYSLYHVKDSSGIEYSFFAPEEVHAKIVQAGLKAGDSFWISKQAVQNGKKVTTKLEVEVPAKPAPEAKQIHGSEAADDGYRDLMEKSLRDAIEATKAVNTMQWSVEDIKSLAVTLFIQ